MEKSALLQTGPLTEAAIRSHLGPTAVVGRTLRCFDALDSTNTWAKDAARRGAPEGLVVIADRQTAGRGRLGRSFQSPAGLGLYLTALLRPELPAEELAGVTALAGVAVCRAVERVCGAAPGLKWPNDPVLNGKKLCGILTEHAPGAYLVIGVGVNVLQRPEDFSPDVARTATSLLQELGRPVSRAALAAAEIEELDRLWAGLRRGGAAEELEEYRRRCVTVGRTVQLQDGGARRTVEAVGIDDRFGLTVRDGAGREWTVRSGEVSVRGLYGYCD